MIYSASDNYLHLEVDQSLYNDAVLFNCFYWYTKNYDVSIDAGSVHLQFKKHHSAEEITELKEKINRDLVDFKLRDIVSAETKTIRELLIAKAFSHYHPDNPINSVSDPVGFNPNDIK